MRLRLLLPLLLICGWSDACFCADEPSSATLRATPPLQSLVKTFCTECHGREERSGGLDLERIVSLPLAEHRREWERVVRKLRARQMPPDDITRPKEADYARALSFLTASLDKISSDRPRLRRTSSLRRLTRAEYQNAIRDLLALEIDAADLLPKDDVSHGFDNVTVSELSPTLLNRYVASAQKISRLAVGSAGRATVHKVVRVRPDLTQEKHLTGLPLGTRGGTLIPFHFPQAGDYEVRVRLARDRNEHVEGLRGKHEMDVLLDRKRVKAFVIRPPVNKQDHLRVDAHLTTRMRVTAGPHRVGITFAAKAASLLETKRQPYQSRFNMHRHPRTSPAVYQVSISGPFAAKGAGETPSRRRIFICRPSTSKDEMACAKRILAALARRAWRRPITNSDLKTALKFFRQGQSEGGFETGIESALASLLVNPQFFFRIERDPAAKAGSAIQRVTDMELASRLSFFLWSSIPDDELLALAEKGELHRPPVLRRQVRRMLTDARSTALVTNFAGQWLYLRNLDTVHPDMRLFPDFDHNLRRAMRTETELFVQSVVREDRSVLDLLRAKYTFLNERLARHYGIPHIHGSRFRRVLLPQDGHRGGLLRQASILTVTSYATRTSPVLRGQWILKNLLGTPPPPPPDDVPALKDNTVSSRLPVRQRLAQHRADPNCASCHRLMDPVGFSLENYDAIGRWRTRDAGLPIDASGGLPDGSKFLGASGLTKGLLKRPELFVSTLTEKLMTYALGRGVDEDDAAEIRKVLRAATKDDYRFSTLVQGIVESRPFQMRATK